MDKYESIPILHTTELEQVWNKYEFLAQVWNKNGHTWSILGLFLFAVVTSGILEHLPGSTGFRTF